MSGFAHPVIHAHDPLKMYNGFIISNMIFLFILGCQYPTFYDLVDGQCVMTCPSGTYGVVNEASSDVSLNYTRNCTTSK